MSDKKHADVHDLLEKGEGVLTKRGNVWTYPGCPNDTSGTNLVMPMEYVSDQAVQAALADGALRAAVVNSGGLVTSVRHIDDETAVISAGSAGTAEMGTELPPNSRVEQDAGAGVTTAADAERQVTEGLQAARTPVPQAAPAHAAAQAKGGDVKAKR